MAILRFMKDYNNYYNRIIKVDNSSTILNTYTGATFENVNFNEGNGLSTTQVINWNQDWSPNYMFIMNNASTEVELPIVNYISYLSCRNYYGAGSTERWYIDPSEVPNAFETLGFYNPQTKIWSISNMANYENENYSGVYLDFDFDTILGYIPLDKFSFKWNFECQYCKINIYNYDGDGGDADYTLTKPDNGIVNASYILQCFPELVGVSNVQISSMALYGSSPDEIWGSMIDDDYNSVYNIKERWFVINWEKIRNNQYRASLKRDVIADNYYNVISSPVYINKAIIKDNNDPAIFNKEDIKVNQIKQSEYPVVEADYSTGNVCPINWIVGYATKQEAGAEAWTEEVIATEAIANKYNTWSDFPLNSIVTQTDGTYTAFNADAKYVGAYIPPTDYTFGNERGWVEEYSYTGYSTNMPSNAQRYVSNVYSIPEIFINSTRYLQYVKQASGLRCSVAPGEGNPKANYGSGYMTDGVRNMLINNKSSYQSGMNSYIASKFGVENVSLDSARYWDSKTIKVGNNYYLLTVQYEEYNRMQVADDTMSSSLISDVFNNYTNAYFTSQGWSGTPTYANVFYGMKGTRFNIYARQVEQPQVTIAAANPNATTEAYRTYNFSKVPYVNDAPYCIFAIPYTEEWYNTKMNIQGPFDNTDSHQGTREISKEKAFTLAQYIAGQLQEGAFLLDMMILPYAPFDISVTDAVNNCLRITYLPETHGHLFYTKDSSNNYSAYYPCFFAEKSDHKHIGGIWNGTLGKNGFADFGFNQTVVEQKISNQCDLFRFNSPSKSQFYDFVPAMNNGLSTIYIDFTYKPYQPFIYLRPKNYNNSLYGNNAHDYIGLIATGDYSMPLLTDQWKLYQINNKNYQKTFDRQVQHQEFENKWALAESITNMFTAPLQGAAGGAAAGSAAGPYGAIIGAAIGGTVGQIGSIADFAKTINSQKENMSYMKDMFNYNIENIQALPDTLTSTTGFDAINKIYPFVEYYSCFSKEREAVENKLLYSGMTVNRIDNIINFRYGDSTNYTQGILIRLEGDENNPEEVNEINTELMKGVFL